MVAKADNETAAKAAEETSRAGHAARHPKGGLGSAAGPENASEQPSPLETGRSRVPVQLSRDGDYGEVPSAPRAPGVLAFWLSLAVFRSAAEAMFGITGNAVRPVEMPRAAEDEQPRYRRLVFPSTLLRRGEVKPLPADDEFVRDFRALVAPQPAPKPAPRPAPPAFDYDGSVAAASAPFDDPRRFDIAARVAATGRDAAKLAETVAEQRVALPLLREYFERCASLLGQAQLQGALREVETIHHKVRTALAEQARMEREARSPAAMAERLRAAGWSPRQIAVAMDYLGGKVLKDPQLVAISVERIEIRHAGGAFALTRDQAEADRHYV